MNLHPPDYQHIRTQHGGITWLASLAGRKEKARREGRRDNNYNYRVIVNLSSQLEQKGIQLHVSLLP